MLDKASFRFLNKYFTGLWSWLYVVKKAYNSFSKSTTWKIIEGFFAHHLKLLFFSLVHGNWSKWSAWSACSSSCGGGSKRRHRTCTDPVPSFGGLSCFGNAEDYSDCATPNICQGIDYKNEHLNTMSHLELKIIGIATEGFGVVISARVLPGLYFSLSKFVQKTLGGGDVTNLSCKFIIKLTL